MPSAPALERTRTKWSRPLLSSSNRIDNYRLLQASELENRPGGSSFQRGIGNLGGGSQCRGDERQRAGPGGEGEKISTCVFHDFRGFR